MGELIIFLATSLVFITKALDNCPASTANKDATIFKQSTLVTEHGFTLNLMTLMKEKLKIYDLSTCCHQTQGFLNKESH